MANVQPENGCVRIAYDLDAALIRADLSGLEKDIARTVVHLTYGADRTKAEIGVQDLRLFLSGTRRIRTERVAEALESLIAKNIILVWPINQHRRILGIQKDFEKWGALTEKVDKKYMSINRVLNINTSLEDVDKMSTIVDYAHKGTEFSYSIPSYRVELKHTKQLYAQALALTRDPKTALLAIRDYIDDLNDQAWFKGCKMRCVYMSSRFKQWYKSTPAKSKRVKEDEAITGYRYRYSTVKQAWVVAQKGGST